MKRLMFIVFLLVSTLTVFGQKKDSLVKVVKPPSYKADPYKIYEVNIKGTLDQFNSLSFIINNGIPLVDSTDYPAKLRNSVKMYTKTVVIKINRDIDDLLIADKKKFQTDSLNSLKIKK